MLHRIVSRSVVVLAGTAFLASCEDNTTGTPLTPPPPSTAVVVSAVAPVPEDGVVDTDIAGPVTFKATNPDGSPGAGIVLQFIAAGGGVVERSQATTGSDGTASPGVWHLGRKAGTQRVTASPPSGDPAFIDVTVAPGAFAVLNSPANLPNSAQIANQPTAVAPVYVVADQFNNRAGDSIEVTFEALEGSIDDTDPILSSSNGDVSPGAWTLGGTVGPQRLVAHYVVNGAAVSDTVTVEAVCSVSRASFGTPINGQWRTTDCDNGTNLVNVYGFATNAQASYNATVSGAVGQALQLKTAIGVVVQDVLPTYLYSNLSNPYSVSYVVNTGAYQSWALAPGMAAVLNSYTINDNGANNGVDDYLPPVGCAQVGDTPFFAMIGVDAFATFEGNTCNAGGYATFQDRYLIQLAAGEEFEALAIQSAGQAATTVLSLRIRDARTAGGAVVVVGVPAGATGANARTLFADYTVPAGAGGLYEVIVGSPVDVGTPDGDPFEYNVIFTTP
jgi:hypothetical protein